MLSPSDLHRLSELEERRKRLKALAGAGAFVVGIRDLDAQLLAAVPALLADIAALKARVAELEAEIEERNQLAMERDLND